jgi:hypothetical protein
VWKLVLDHTYYEHSVLVLKLCVTEWYQSRVDHRNASLVRSHFSSLFYNQNYFYSTLSKTSILWPIFAFYLIFSSTSIIQMKNNRSCNFDNGDNNAVENPPSTLEQLLIIQAQLLQIVKQILLQMQDINQMMQSLEVRPSSRKWKGNTQNDASKA